VASKIAEDAEPKKKNKTKLHLSARTSKNHACKAQKDKPGQSLLLGM
jgi:hypothetical protein